MKSCLSALLLPLALLAADPKIELMKQRTLYVGVASEVDGKRGAGNGSGFAVDDRHVVTNWHVCCKFPEGAKVVLGIPLGENEIIEARPVWSSQAKDLGILELVSPLPRPVSPLSKREFLEEAQTVYAFGFPAASRSSGGVAAILTPTITTGIISKFMPFQTSKELPEFQVVQMSAAINPGNSGGPLFTACGEVAAINFGMAKDSSGQGVAQGINLSILVDELRVELDKLGVKYQSAAGPCVAAAPSAGGVSWIWQGFTMLIALGALVLAFSRKTRVRVTESLRRTEPTAPKLVGLSGAYAGESLALSSRKPCVLGRDPQGANLIFPPDTKGVSGKHCELRWDAATGRVFLTDLGSMNGTYVAGGRRLQPGAAQEMQPGDKFYLGSQQVEFTVKA